MIPKEMIEAAAQSLLKTVDQSAWDRAEAALTAALACQHKSDCATNNGPARLPGPCDCGAGKEGEK